MPKMQRENRHDPFTTQRVQTGPNTHECVRSIARPPGGEASEWAPILWVHMGEAASARRDAG